MGRLVVLEVTHTVYLPLLLTGRGRGFLQAGTCLGKGRWLSEGSELP